jgi:hypothetical protein
MRRVINKGVASVYVTRQELKDIFYAFENSLEVDISKIKKPTDLLGYLVRFEIMIDSHHIEPFYGWLKLEEGFIDV